MNYSTIIEQLQQADGFDLYRLRCAINRLLDEPRYTDPIRSALKIGDEVEYFDAQTNKAVKCTILKLNRTTASIRNTNGGERRKIPFYMFNHNNIDTAIQTQNKKGLSRNEIAVGDWLGFTSPSDNSEHYGKVVRLNQKTVTLKNDKMGWRVPYSLLFKVIGEQMEAIGEIQPTNPSHEPY